MPNFTTNYAITYTNLGYLNPALNNQAQSFTRKAPKQYYNCPAQLYFSTSCYNITDF